MSEFAADSLIHALIDIQYEYMKKCDKRYLMSKPDTEALPNVNIAVTDK